MVWDERSSTIAVCVLLVIVFYFLERHEKEND